MTPLSNNDTGAGPPAGQILFRKMDESDIDSYCTLFQAVFACPPWNEKRTVKEINDDIRKLMAAKEFIGIAATAGLNRIGFVAGCRLWGFPKAFYLAQLFVDRAMRDKGIGSLLVRETAVIVKEHGIVRMFLLTKPDCGAEEFYRRNDFNRWVPWFRIRGKCILHKKI